MTVTNCLPYLKVCAMGSRALPQTDLVDDRLCASPEGFTAAGL